MVVAPMCRTGPSQYLGDLHLAQHRAQRFDLLNDVAHETRGYLFTGSCEVGPRRQEPCSSTRLSQERMVSEVTKNSWAVCSKIQPRAAFSWRMAIRSVGG